MAIPRPRDLVRRQPSRSADAAGGASFSDLPRGGGPICRPLDAATGGEVGQKLRRDLQGRPYFLTGSNFATLSATLNGLCSRIGRFRLNQAQALRIALLAG
jgi:hypothetical protein